MSLRVVIVDDEPLVRQGIESVLSRLPDVEIVALCGDGLAAIAAIEEQRPDLVLLDVQMPALDGFETLDALDIEPLPGVVFVTAHDEYALRAFDVHAVDYVLKPFSTDRLLTALARARERMGSTGRTRRMLRQLLEERRSSQRFLGQFVVRRARSLQFVQCHDVNVIRACDNYVILTDREGGTHMVRATIKDLVERLDPTMFCRVHRSAIVRLEAIHKVRPRPSGDADAVLGAGTLVPISRSYKHELLERLAFCQRSTAGATNRDTTA